MPTITLISDWQNDDYYISSVKGRILGEIPGAGIVDITHRIQHFSIAQAAFILRSSYRSFPDGTVHIIGVNSEANEKHPYVAVRYRNHFFICADNGIFGLMFEDEPEEIIILNEKEISSFPELSLFVPAAAHICAGKPLFELGRKTDHLNRPTHLLPAFDNNSINGSVVYIDSYNNIITNITRELFEKVAKGRYFEIYPQSNHYKITRINKRYNETTPGEILALFNSLGLLEIAMNQGNIAELLSLNISSTIRIKFFDKKETDTTLLDNFK